MLNSYIRYDIDLKRTNENKFSDNENERLHFVNNHIETWNKKNNKKNGEHESSVGLFLASSFGVNPKHEIDMERRTENKRKR